MAVYLVKRLTGTNIANGKSYNTENIKVENAVSVSIVEESGVEKFAISDGENTYKYNVSDYVLSVTN